MFNGVVYEENFMEAVQIPFHRWKLNEHVLDVLELQILRMKLLLLGIYLVRVLDPLCAAALIKRVHKFEDVRVLHGASLPSRPVGVKHLQQLLVVVLILLDLCPVLVYALQIANHIVDILIAAFDSELPIDDSVHLSDGQLALDE